MCGRRGWCHVPFFILLRAKKICLPKKFWYGIFLCVGGGIMVLSKFLFHLTENFKCVPSVFQNCSRLEKCMDNRRGGIRLFRRNYFCLSAEKNLWRNTLMFPKIYSVGKNIWWRDGGYYFFHRIFFVSQCRKISRGNPSMFLKIWGSKKFMHKKGISLSFIDCFLSHSAEKILSFEKLPYRKFSCIGGGIMVLSKKFYFTWPKNFVGCPFCVSENFWHRKVLCLRRRGARECQVFPSQICCLTVPKNS